MTRTVGGDAVWPARLCIVCLLLAFVAAAGGCALGVSALAVSGQAMTSGSEDVSGYDVYQGQAIWQSYSRNAVYRLKRDVFYGVAYPTRLRLDDLIRPASPLSTIPRTTDSYTADPSRWPAIKGIVPGGARLRMLRVVYVQDLNVHDFYYVGVFEDGPIAGREVALNEISLPRSGMGAARLYDPDFLDPVDVR